MKTYVKEFFHRGLVFGGFGPIVLGIIYAILENTVDGFSFTGWDVCIAILSIYLLAFVQAGASVFNQIEEWSLPKSLGCHFAVLYVAYVGCYLLNRWIPFDIRVVAIFTAVFAVLYFVIWFTVFLIVRHTGYQLNKTLNT